MSAIYLVNKDYLLYLNGQRYQYFVGLVATSSIILDFGVHQTLQYSNGNPTAVVKYTRIGKN